MSYKSNKDKLTEFRLSGMIDGIYFHYYENNSLKTPKWWSIGVSGNDIYNFHGIVGSTDIKFIPIKVKGKGNLDRKVNTKVFDLITKIKKKGYKYIPWIPDKVKRPYLFN